MLQELRDGRNLEAVTAGRLDADVAVVELTSRPGL